MNWAGQRRRGRGGWRGKRDFCWARRTALLLAWIGLLAACAPSVSSEDRVAPDAKPEVRGGLRAPSVVLISLDGTRPDDVTPENLPSLVALAGEGMSAAGLIPVNPSNTFPNHVSLVTGVRPDEHRLVNNSFFDPERGSFKRKTPHEWVESEPIWSIAERGGMPTASFYWVGSEGPWAGGPGPRNTRPFSSRTLEKTKVTQILEWLNEPDERLRPRLITSWFHGADHAGHVSGPGTPAVQTSLAPQDVQIARLIEGMEQRGLFETTTLIFVSDHGMATATRRVNLSSALGKNGLRPKVLGIGGFSSLVFSPKQKTPRRFERAIDVARKEGLEAYLRTEAPASWHVDDPRFGDIVVRAPLGTAIVGHRTLIDGFHGYDANESAMAGILLARGRGVARGVRIDRVSGLSVAPTILTLLGLPIPSQMKAPVIPELVKGVAANPAP